MFMVKKLIGRVTEGIAIAFGLEVGYALYCGIRNPVTRKQCKKKITSVFKKD